MLRKPYRGRRGTGPASFPGAVVRIMGRPGGVPSEIDVNRRVLLTILSLPFVLSFSLPAASVEDSPFSTQMYEPPGKGSGSGRGDITVRHLGGSPEDDNGDRGRRGGGMSEYHLFVPSGIKKGRKVPLLIVYHGGRDGDSGAKLCRSWSRVSTKSDPLIVLSPNAYSMDAYDELIAAGEVPIDERRVYAMGFSSGGSGLTAVANRYAESGGAFRPAGLVAASTKLRRMSGERPPCPYVLMVGEFETPEGAKTEHLGTIRRLCREQAVELRSAFPEMRYIEVERVGHNVNRPEHFAIVQNLIASSPYPQPVIEIKKDVPGLEALVALARAGRYTEAAAELVRLDAEADPGLANDYKALRRKVLSAIEAWVDGGVKRVTKLSRKSKHRPARRRQAP
jgi:hypothetical protein